MWPAEPGERRGRLCRLGEQAPRGLCAPECKCGEPGRSLRGNWPAPSFQRPPRSPVKGAGRSLPLHFTLGLSPLCSLWPGRGRDWGLGTCLLMLGAELTAPTPAARGKGGSHSALTAGILSALVPADHKGDNSSHAIPVTQEPEQGALLERTGLAWPRRNRVFSLCLCFSLPEPSGGGLICETRSWSLLRPLL